MKKKDQGETVLQFHQVVYLHGCLTCCLLNQEHWVEEVRGTHLEMSPQLETNCVWVLYSII